MENTKKRIADRIKKIKNKTKDQNFRLGPDWPNKIKRVDQDLIEERIIELEKLLKSLLPFIKSIKNTYVKDITEKTLMCATYLLLCRVYENFQAIFLLIKNGMNPQTMSLLRINREALDLIASLITQGENSRDLKNWFKGKFIKAKWSQETIMSIIPDKNLSFFSRFLVRSFKKFGADLQKQHYSYLSEYQHNNYYSMLESIDIYNKDFDFKKYSNFTYLRQGFPVFYTFMKNTIIIMQSVFQYLKDEEKYKELNVFLHKIELEKKQYFKSMKIGLLKFASEILKENDINN